MSKDMTYKEKFKSHLIGIVSEANKLSADELIEQIIQEKKGKVGYIVDPRTGKKISVYVTKNETTLPMVKEEI